MLKVKRILNDLVEETYKGNRRLRNYKSFYVSVLNKKMKSKHGDYDPITHYIRVYNLYRPDSAIIATTIHELAHHIDYMTRDVTDHSRAFYDTYRELLYTALDMGLFTKEDYLNATADASDSNKIRKMISGYIPSPTGYKEDKARVIVKNGFDHREKLKSLGYVWNPIEKVWEKEIDKSAAPQEVFSLRKDGMDCETVGTALSFKSIDEKDRPAYYIIVGHGAFPFRDELKKDKFRFDRKDRKWKRGVDKDYPVDIKVEEMKKKYPGMDIRIKKA